MNGMQDFLKTCPYSRELRHIWHFSRKLQYQRVFRYIYYRFWLNPKLRRLPHPIGKPVTTKAYTLHMLCSHVDLCQLLWALASWYHVTFNSPQVYIHDDGTLTPRDVRIIKKLFPEAEVIDAHVVTQYAMQTWLSEFPRTRAIRTHGTNQSACLAYPCAIKLIDPYFISPAKCVLVLDTDVLWFKPPEELEQALFHYTLPVFWRDLRPSSYTLQHGELLKQDVLYCNSGVVGYRKEDFDLCILEEYLRKRGDIDEPTWGFADQPAYAYVLGANRMVSLLPGAQYAMQGEITEATVAFHYTGPRRAKFWIEGVKFLSKTWAIGS